jgi:WD40 repeat protein
MNTTNWTRVGMILLAAGMSAFFVPPAPADDANGSAAGQASKTAGLEEPLPDGALARLGSWRWRHTAPVAYVGFIAQGKQVLTACADGLFHVWDADSGKSLRTFGSVFVRVYETGGLRPQATISGASVALSPDGRVVAGTGQDGMLHTWDVASGKELQTFGEAGNPNARAAGFGMTGLALSPDGKLLASQGNDFSVRLWDVGSGKEIRQLGKRTGAAPVVPRRIRINATGTNLLTFLPDGKALASSSMDLENNLLSAMVHVYDVETGKELRQIKWQPNANGALVTAMAPDGKTVAVASTQGTIKLHDVESGKETRSLALKRPPGIFTALAFAPGGKVLAFKTTNSPAVQLLNVETGAELRALGDEPAPAGAFFGGNVGFGSFARSQVFAFSPDGKTLAEAHAGNTLRLWDVATGKELHHASGHQMGVIRLAVSADGKVISSLGQDGVVLRWDLSSGRELGQLKFPPGTTSVCLSRDGKRAACLLNNITPQLWDVAAGKMIQTFTVGGQPAGFNASPYGGGSMALSQDGKLLAVRSFNQGVAIRIFDTATGKDLRLLSEAASADGNAAVITRGGFAGAPSRLAFSPDGTALATARGGLFRGPYGTGFVGGPGQGDNAVQLWNVAAGKKPRRFDNQPAGVQELAFSPDGSLLATANGDSSISLWEVLTGKECMHLEPRNAAKAAQPGVANPVNSRMVLGPGVGFARALAVSPDGRTLAVGNADHSVALFDLRSGAQLGQFKGHAGVILSLTFASDNRTVISGSGDTTALVWDGGRFLKKETPSAQLTRKEVEALWADLATDPAKAFVAVTELSTAPKEAVAVLKERLKPAAGVDGQRLERLVTDLGDEKFKVRRQAMEELEKLGELAQPALQKVLDGPAALEVRRRVEQLLDKVATDQTPSVDVQRSIRAVYVLEQIATPEAREVLRTVAQGAPGAQLTRHAQGALKRIPN